MLFEQRIYTLGCETAERFWELQRERGFELVRPIMERLIVIPHEGKPGRFSGRLESTGEVIVGSTKQPLVDGARELLAAVLIRLPRSRCDTTADT